MRNSNIELLLFTLMVFGLAVSSQAGDGHCCQHCGCDQSCHKVCRLVCEEKKVEITCWGCKCEDFCIGGPGTRGCTHCETVCDSCDQNGAVDAPYFKPKNFVWAEWFASCGAKVHTKKKLMKKTVTKKVPTYKWVVEDLCDQCVANCDVAEVEPGVEIPAPPQIAGAKVLGIRSLGDVPVAEPHPRPASFAY